MKSNPFISAEYLAQQRALHAHPRGYGGKGSRWFKTVLDLRRLHGAETVLDYGCGRGTLARELRLLQVPCREYDPAIREKSGMPEPADLVVCTDVLEHIEPDRLPAVLEHLRSLTRRAAFLVIATRHASKTLPDGRNAHLIVESSEWWTDRLQQAGFIVESVPDDAAVPLKKPGKALVAVARPMDSAVQELSEP